MNDRFSKQSASYAAFRPTYPKSLYEFILSQVKERQVAWDCACGNGQVAKDLSQHFEQIHATDHTPNQIANAFKADNITYAVGTAEKTAFADNQFSLVTVGQALHWFNIPAFFDEARRVLKPNGVLAIWGYSLLSINKEIDPLINDFYVNTIGPYWDKERKLVDDQYKTIVFPFRKIEVPNFEFSFDWTLNELEGYISTWSSVQKYVRQHGRNPVEELVASLQPLWRESRYKVVFPLFVLMGKNS